MLTNISSQLKIRMSGSFTLNLRPKSDDFKAVVAWVPSGYVWQGISNTMKLASSRNLSPLLYFMLDDMHRCTYNIIMLFEWDSKKAISNLKKHGVDFADAVTVLEDERAITILDDYPDEERFVTVGMDSFGRILVVVYAWRDSRIRIISARKATAKEIKEYKG